MTNKDLRIERIRDCIFRDREGNVVLKLDRVKSIEISAAYSASELPNFKCNFDAYDIDFCGDSVDKSDDQEEDFVDQFKSLYQDTWRP